MVLEVLPHAREIDGRVDAELLEVIRCADAGQEEEARRMDRPGAKDHLSRCARGMQLAVQEEIEAGAARAGERQLDRLCPGQYCQVLMPHDRPQVRAPGAAARAV